MSEGERGRVWPGRRVGVGGLGGTGSVRLAPVRGDLGASLQCLALCILPGSKWEEGAGKGRGGGLTVASHDPHPEWMLEPVLRCLPAVPQTPGCSMYTNDLHDHITCMCAQNGKRCLEPHTTGSLYAFQCSNYHCRS